MEEFDLVVIGTGSAGSAPAHRCRAAGWRVAVVDDQPFGGTCALRGCDPKKVLVGAADVVAWQQRMRGHGVAGEATIDWPALMRFRSSFTDPVPARREGAYAEAGITMLHGEARFVAEDRLVVDGRELAARYVVIAAGSEPRTLGIPGEEQLTSSTGFLALENLPRRIAFVGVGYIALEFAHVARRAGAEVVMLGRGTPLPGFDADAVARLLAHTREIGVDVRLETSVVGVERVDSPSSGGLYRVHARRDASAGGEDGPFSVDVDLVVHGAGRVPSTARLDTRAGNVRTDGRGAVEVNEFLQSTSNHRVYAAGDVALPPHSLPLTPVAGHEGGVVAWNLLHGPERTADYRAIPSAVFTVPPLAAVGLTESAARAQGIDVRVQSGETSGWFSHRRVREGTGFYKTIVERGSDRLRGAHLFGGHAEEVINLFAMAMRFDIPATAVREMILAYPTSGSDVPYML